MPQHRTVIHRVVGPPATYLVLVENDTGVLNSTSGHTNFGTALDSAKTMLNALVSTDVVRANISVLSA